MVQPNASFNISSPPNITEAELNAFYASHFSPLALEDFSTHFLGPIEEIHYEEEEDDDGLGYYPDGVKRTLTDEQIAIFRHSEIQTLLRDRRHAEENGKRDEKTPDEAEEGELDDNVDPALEICGRTNPDIPAAEEGREGAAKKKGRRSQQRKRGGAGGQKQHGKPDLRKRTWDKVDRGLESLEYGEEENGAAKMPAAAQRRRVSYEDV